jgi:hypothetical protein
MSESHCMTETSDNVVALPKRYRYEGALIAAGEYSARVLDLETKVYWRWSARVVVWWLVVEQGSAFETVLPSYFAVPRLIGEERRHGRFKPVGFKSRLARSLLKLPTQGAANILTLLTVHAVQP